MSSDSEKDEAIVRIENVLQDFDEEDCIVMGGIDDKSVCTFTRGYVKRQALYTCRTCLDIDEVKAGICFPCAIQCHAGHDLVELYTKRSFRCDCGNIKFAGVCECILWEEKDDENGLNQYNDNFSNRYCTCQRSYPDPNYNGTEEMIQCGVCENWYHLEHLNMDANFRTPDNYEEMTCFICLQKNTFLFLQAYNTEAMFRQSCETGSNTKCSTLVHPNFTPELKKLRRSESDESEKSEDNSACRLAIWANKMNCHTPDFRYLSVECLDGVDHKRIPSVFWVSGWRNFLCRCEECRKMYKHFKVEFLLDPEDSMSHYLQLAKERTKSINEEEKRALSEALSELPHPVAVNFATGLARLKGALEEFFTKKRDEDHVVTESEVRAFFEDFRKHNQL
ncbi:unnamed protein product [Heterobilharzia americana]|nr:unnamed protein product [Heterobilharzia americana]CAH8480908.1 unnamed protein product [Heterobilharzia americana]